MSLQRKCPFHVTIAGTEAKLVQSLCDVLQLCANRALENSDTFRVGLSGGSLVQLLTRALVSSNLDTKCWKFFFCDERYVPDYHNESTFWAYKTQMLSQLPNISDSQLIKPDTTMSLDNCASAYAACIRDEFGTSCPEFDLLLLGMGPDGHTCSLFPEQPIALSESRRIVIPIRNSPKPPPERITFTLPLINNAKDVVFVVTGASKADVVKRVFADKDKNFPSAWVEPTHGELTLIADKDAGKTFLNSSCQCPHNAN
ncbi:probable 6-phosphogluconolactonase [Drosophila novamexicana]|uniref:probable 6-phosphogluconolactonase n=1 Tax=Drosophila novamexicana TaxID=47314 RepID=UPI0011E5C16C|nr:probable 6-phosphogluconolactonase [Drosophila novamexicana]